MSEVIEDEETSEKAVRSVKTAYDLQRLKLEKLLKQPDKPVFIPNAPKERKMPKPPEFIRNTWGSSAGAGSGDFHVYRGVRRREYARQKFLDEKEAKTTKDAAYQRRLEENAKAADERTAKKRARRLKKKQKSKQKKTTKSAQVESDSESEDDETELPAEETPDGQGNNVVREDNTAAEHVAQEDNTAVDAAGEDSTATDNVAREDSTAVDAVGEDSTATDNAAGEDSSAADNATGEDSTATDNAAGEDSSAADNAAGEDSSAADNAAGEDSTATDNAAGEDSSVAREACVPADEGQTPDQHATIHKQLNTKPMDGASKITDTHNDCDAEHTGGAG